MRVEHTILINRPVQAVFGYVADFKTGPEWMGWMSEAHQTSEGPMEVGATAHNKGKVMGRKLETDTEVIEYVPQHSLVLKSLTGMPSTFHYTFEPVAEGTKLTIVTEAHIAGLFKVAEPLVGNAFHRQSVHDMETLKDLLEAEVTT